MEADQKDATFTRIKLNVPNLYSRIVRRKDDEGHRTADRLASSSLLSSMPYN